MRDEEQWKVAWAAARDLALSLGPQHEIELTALSDDLWEHGTLPRGGTQELNEALAKAQQIAKGRAARSTRLVDGVLSLAHSFPEDSFGGVIYLVTDAMDKSSRAHLSDVETELVGKGVRVFVLVPRYGFVPFRMRGLPSPEELTNGLTSRSGGRALVLSRYKTKTDELPRLLRPMYESILRPYRIEVEPSSLIDKQREWKLEVVDIEGKPLKDVELAYPRLLVPLKAK